MADLWGLGPPRIFRRLGWLAQGAWAAAKCRELPEAQALLQEAGTRGLGAGTRDLGRDVGRGTWGARGPIFGVGVFWGKPQKTPGRLRGWLSF